MKTVFMFGLAFVLVAWTRDAAAFPSESEVGRQLRPEITVGEVIERFGQPGNHVAAGDGSFRYRYIAPIGTLNDEHEGYVGFEMHFVEGKLADWRTLRETPSFAPAPAPWWIGRVWVIGALVIAVATMFRRKRSGVDEDHDLLDAYIGRRLETRELAEFQFITHETTLQEVMDKLGPPSLMKTVSLKEAAGPEKAAAYDLSNLTIELAEYDLPYGAAAVVMPEYPCQPENKIRAVYYRGPSADDDTPIPA